MGVIETSHKTGDTSDLTDEHLLALSIQGDEEAFTTLYRRRQAAVYRFALLMNGSRPAAEEVTQDVFMTLLRKAENFDSARGSVSAYLYGLTRNFVLRFLERNRCSFPAASEGERDVEAFGEPASQSAPLDELIRNERIESVRLAVLALPEPYREVVVICDLQEKSYAEAASCIGCSLGTVRSRLHRARALLIKKLSAESSADMGQRQMSRARSLK